MRKLTEEQRYRRETNEAVHSFLSSQKIGSPLAYGLYLETHGNKKKKKRRS